MLVHLELSQCVVMNLCVPTLCSEKKTHSQFFFISPCHGDRHSANSTTWVSHDCRYIRIQCE